MNTNYRVWWYSDRGFANEGSYVYGSFGNVGAMLDGKINTTLMSKHKTFDAAKKAAEKLSARDKRNRPAHEIISIGTIDAAEWLRDHSND